jgi:hypothetical protein
LFFILVIISSKHFENCSVKMLLPLAFIAAFSIAVADAGYTHNAKAKEIKSQYQSGGITSRSFHYARHSKLHQRFQHHGHLPAINSCGQATAASLNSTDGTIPAGTLHLILFDNYLR